MASAWFSSRRASCSAFRCSSVPSPRRIVTGWSGSSLSASCWSSSPGRRCAGRDGFRARDDQDRKWCVVANTTRKRIVERVVMDFASQQVTRVFEALARTEDKLRSFGYQLYLGTKAEDWTQPNGLAFCASESDSGPTTPAATVGFAIHRDDNGEKAVVFSVVIRWEAARWSVQSFVEDEDVTREDITVGLWESPEYQGGTLDELLTSLEQSVDALMSSTQEPKVAAMLATIRRWT